MADITIDGLPSTALFSDTDVMHLNQSTVDKKATLLNLTEYFLRDSTYAQKYEMLTSDKDYLAADVEPDYRIISDSSASDNTIGLFNGSARGGAIVVIRAIGTGNNTLVELVTSGVTDVTMSPGDTLIVMWDSTNSAWLKLENI